MNEFFTIGTICLLGAMAPGPDFAVIVRNALAFDKSSGLYTATGIALGTLFHTTYCILGLAYIISRSILAFNIIKIIGALYLIYLGIQALRSKKIDPRQIASIKEQAKISNMTALKQGILCNVLNPKATLFFMGIFTLVVTPGTSNLVQLGYGLEIFVITLVWFSSLVLLLNHKQVKARIGKFQYYISKLMGVFLILFGADLIATTR